MLINLPSCFPITQMKQGERWRELKFCRSGRPKYPKIGLKLSFGLQTDDIFCRLAPPRREAAAYGMAYLSTKRLGAVKSLSGRAAMFVAAKTFFCQESRDQPTFTSKSSES